MWPNGECELRLTRFEKLGAGMVLTVIKSPRGSKKPEFHSLMTLWMCFRREKSGSSSFPLDALSGVDVMEWVSDGSFLITSF